MEVEEMQTPGCKFPRIRNRSGRINDDAAKIGHKGDEQNKPEEDEADGEEEVKRANVNGSAGGGGRGGVGVGGLDITASGGLGRLCGWPSSRIVRVSRASGGKDRHSKVLTTKGLRDRRVRLSVTTAIQFYDLQDRLGYDQPSKAVDWLLKAAASSIAELPLINTAFPDTPQQLSDEKRSSAGTLEHGFDSAEVEMEGELNYQQQQQQLGAFSKSACSSTSETSKGSGLSLSRSENRIKARERARERAAEKEKEKEKEESSRVAHQPHLNVNPISENSSFTQLLTAGMSNSANVSNSSSNNNTTGSPNGGSIHQNPRSSGGSGGGNGNSGTANESNFFHKSSPRHWSSTPMDYFATRLLGLSSSSRAIHQPTASFLGQIQLGNPLHQSLTSVSSPLFTITADHHHHSHNHHTDLPHFSFVPDHLVPVVTAAGGNGNSHSNHTGNGNGNGSNSDYNLNFTISSSSSSGLAGFNRGTLQSNSSSPPSLLPHVQRFSPIDGPSSAFFSSTTASPPNAAVAPVENHHHHHHFLPGFDARLQLCYGDGTRHSDHKSKGKN